VTLPRLPIAHAMLDKAAGLEPDRTIPDMGMRSVEYRKEDP
jgi:hypothetical protein